MTEVLMYPVVSSKNSDWFVLIIRVVIFEKKVLIVVWTENLTELLQYEINFHRQLLKTIYGPVRIA